MAKANNYGLSEETMEKAKAYMVQEGYMDPSDDIISYTRPMVEDIDFMVKAKINQWAAAYENSQNK
jgi:hypothetical protein